MMNRLQVSTCSRSKEKSCPKHNKKDAKKILEAEIAEEQKKK
jgi:hypothetical protein